MSSDIEAYKKSLKWAWAQVYGGKPEDWTAGPVTTDKDGAALCEFKNEKNGIVLQVTDTLPRAEGKFSAKRVDAAAAPDDAANVAFPPGWKA